MMIRFQINLSIKKSYDRQKLSYYKYITFVNKNKFSVSKSMTRKINYLVFLKIMKFTLNLLVKIH